METEVGLEVTLPDEVVEKILAMVPFPYIFKARVLSKSWLAKFSSISSREDEEKKRLITTFQKQVRVLSKSWLAKFSSISPQEDEEKKRLITTFQKQVGEQSSTKWKTFCPVLLRKENIIAYDQGSQRWRRMPLLSFLPDKLCISSHWWQLQGALLLIRTDEGKDNLYVANVLTRTWKQLPRLPFYDIQPGLVKSTFLEDMRLIHMSSQRYKVVAFRTVSATRNSQYQFSFLEVYDSKAGAWSRKIHHYVPEDFRYWRVTNDWAFLNGVFYMFVGSKMTDGALAGGLLAFNLEEENFTLLQMANIQINSTDKTLPGKLVVWKSNLVSIEPHAHGNQVTIFKFDMGSRSWSEVTRGPPAALNFGSFVKRAACDGDSFFFLGKEVGSGFLAYNVHENEWSSFPLPPTVQELHDPLISPRSRSHLRAPPSGLPSIHCRGPLGYRGQCQWDYSLFQPGLNPFIPV